MREDTDVRYCSRCNEQQDESAFYAGVWYCKACWAIYYARYRAAHPDTEAKRREKYNELRRQRARMKRENAA